MIRLLCTDLDRTLLPNGEAPVCAEAMPTLKHLIRSAKLSLVYVTGRDVARVRDAIEQYELPMPDFIVADVGSSVYNVQRNTWQFDQNWQQRIGGDWQGLDTLAIHRLLEADRRLQRQEDDRQQRFKCSYYIARDEDTESLEQSIRKQLTVRGVDAALLFSDDPVREVGLLDVLPARATKLHAVNYIRGVVGAQTVETVFAGDSGNDIDVLASAIPGILVANADKRTRLLARQRADAAGHAAALYVAKGGLDLPTRETLNGNYSAGIVEGMLHYDPGLQRHLPSWAAALTSPSSTRY